MTRKLFTALFAVAALIASNIGNAAQAGDQYSIFFFDNANVLTQTETFTLGNPHGNGTFDVDSFTFFGATATRRGWAMPSFADETSSQFSNMLVGQVGTLSLGSILFTMAPPPPDRNGGWIYMPNGGVFQSGTYSLSAIAAAVPEPGTLGMVLLGIFLVAGVARRRTVSESH